MATTPASAVSIAAAAGANKAATGIRVGSLPVASPTQTGCHLAVAIAAAISDAGLPGPTPDIFAAPYLDICPPGLRGTDPNPWTTIHPLRPSPGEIERMPTAEAVLHELVVTIDQ